MPIIHWMVSVIYIYIYCLESECLETIGLNVRAGVHFGRPTWPVGAHACALLSFEPSSEWQCRNIKMFHRVRRTYSMPANTTSEIQKSC